MPTWILDWLPPVAVVVMVIVLLMVLRWFFKRRSSGMAGRTLLRQAIIATLLFLGLLTLIVSLPIDDTTRGQLLSLISLIISAAIALSSATFVGNMMAGVLLRVVRNFRLGDFIEVEGNFGRVSEQGLLHTEIQTEDRDLVTLPNLFLVRHPIRVVASSGTVVSADVSLGYDVSHRTVQSALMAAAAAAGLKEPFVRILELGDFSVAYRVAGILDEVKQLLTVRSLLRAAVLDHLHGVGIEIVSPRFQNQRILSEQQRFVPPAEPGPTAAANSEEIFPEELVFDKAEKAESLEKLRTAHTSLSTKVAELENRLKETPKGDQKEALKRRVARARELQDRLARRIEDAV